MSSEDADVLDSLLEKLRNGDAIGTRKARRGKPAAISTEPPAPLNLNLDAEGTADIARDMLAQLQSNGFVMPASPTVPVPSVPSTRRRRPRADPTSLLSASTELVNEGKSEEVPDGT